MKTYESTNATRAPARTLGDQLPELWTTAGLVETDHSLPEISGIEAEHQAVVGEPAPMALFGFATGTLLVGITLAGYWPLGELVGVLPALLWFAGVGQFIGGIVALARGSTFAATAFCSFGMGNIIVGSTLWMQHAGLIPATAATGAMLGVVLFCLGYIAVTLAIAALRSNVIYLATVALLIPGYTLAGITHVGGSAANGVVGGWFLIVAALCAFYAGGAVVVNSQWRRAVLPMGGLH